MTSDHIVPAVMTSAPVASSGPLLSAPAMRVATPGMTLTDAVFERLLRERIIVLGS